MWCLPDPQYYNSSITQEYYVESSPSSQSFGNGTADNPFRSVYYCFSQIFSLRTKIIFSEGKHIYKKDSSIKMVLRSHEDDPLDFDIRDQILSIELMGKSYSNLSMIYWTGSLKISSKSLKFYIKNIIFYGDQIIRNDCDGTKPICFYCPTYNAILNLNDKMELVNPTDKKY